MDFDKLLKKYEDSFEDISHKKDFFEFVYSVERNISKKENLKDFYELLEYLYKEYTSLNKKAPVNIYDIFLSFFDNSDPRKIDDEEFSLIIKAIKDFVFKKRGVLKLKKVLEKDYGIKIVFPHKKQFFGDIQSLPLNSFQMSVFVKIIGKLLRRYPKIFIYNINLANIVVANFIKKDQYGKTMILGGLETLKDNNVYLSFYGIKDSFDHEIYHQAMQYYDDFKKWYELRKNQDTFYKYEDLDKEVPGFARNYGKENIAEDQATIAEEIMKNYKHITERSLKDNILRKKIELVKKAYYKLSEGKMDEDFFKSLK